MKLIADESVDYGIKLWLRYNGYEVLAIEDLYKGSDDEEVLNISLKQNSLLIT
jgi:predicted nuclease of predicted toxin-antitoxin system